MIKTHELLMTIKFNEVSPLIHIVHVPCAAHTEALVTKAFMKSGPAKDIIKHMVKVIKAIESSRPLRATVANSQSASVRLKLVKSNDTRWSNTLVALTRFIQLRKPIIAALSAANDAEPNPGRKHDGYGLKLEESWWAKAIELEYLLKPFELVMNQLQSDSVTLHTVNKIFDALYVCLQKMAESATYFREPAKQAIGKFNDAYGKPMTSCKARQFVRVLMMQLNAGVADQPQIQWPFNKINDDESKPLAERLRAKSAADEKTTDCILVWYYTWAANYLINTKANCVSLEANYLKYELKRQWQDFVARHSSRIYKVYNYRLKEFRKNGKSQRHRCRRRHRHHHRRHHRRRHRHRHRRHRTASIRSWTSGTHSRSERHCLHSGK